MLQGDRRYVLCVLKKKKKSKGESQRKKARAKVRCLKLQVGKVTGLPWLPKFPGFGTTLTLF